MRGIKLVEICNLTSGCHKILQGVAYRFTTLNVHNVIHFLELTAMQASGVGALGQMVHVNMQMCRRCNVYYSHHL